jgi:arginine/lysine/ornithine decarboxylase
VLDDIRHFFDSKSADNRIRGGYMKTLEQMLWDYGEGGRYPFHMPGHKRNPMQSDEGIAGWLNEIHRLDITEITDFDNLHHPEGVIRQLEEELTDFYHTTKTYPLVGGSTAGILSAISACTQMGDHILVGRNCHKSVLNACMLRNLHPHFLYPQWVEECGFYGGILPEDVDEYLKNHENIRAVVVVSPTYEGIVSDIHKIAEVVHGYGIPLIVDEAHGAHFSYSAQDSTFPHSAVEEADLVVQSLHKTLPCMTQTGLLHVNGERVRLELLERFLESYQTSSPSYVMMADISHCFHYMKEHPGLMEHYEESVLKLRKKLEKLEFLDLPGKKDIGKYGIFDYDIGRLVLVPQARQMTGKVLFELLRDRYGFELEMSSVTYCIAITSPMDSDEAYEGFVCALEDLNQHMEQNASGCVGRMPICRPERIRGPYEAEMAQTEEVEPRDALGRISARNLYVYPPGVAFITAGEQIDGPVLEEIRMYEQQDFDICGMSPQGRIVVVKEQEGR